MRVIVPLWLAFVVAISTMPLRLKKRIGTTGVLHTPGHVVVFLITAILLCKTAPNLACSMVRWVAACCFALAMEILEAGIYHNRIEWRDVLVDLLGAALGFVVLSIFRFSSGRVQNSEI